ncbi:unnamed protein product [Polarella glacialis]|uniref:Uncharacterized protein n=1 Tax=Polarella glacialis TaxID=89957 RepID=A0A813EHZ6_POLGL|nr:unnamed protein product [Polarella glacialis]
MIIVESPIRLELAMAFETLWCPAGLGDFTDDADKKQVAYFMKLLLRNKLQASLAMGKFHEYRLLLNMQGNLLKNLPISYGLTNSLVTKVLPSLPKKNNNNSSNNNNTNNTNKTTNNNNNDAVPPEDEQSATVQEFLHQNLGCSKCYFLILLLLVILVSCCCSVDVIFMLSPQCI